MPQEEGRKSRCTEETMITNRSSHMPTLGKSTMPNANHGLRRTLRNQNAWGTTQLQNIIASQVSQ